MYALFSCCSCVVNSSVNSDMNSTLLFILHSDYCCPGILLQHSSIFLLSYAIKRWKKGVN